MHGDKGLGHAEYPQIDSDFSRIEGTSCYCSDEAAGQIRQAVAALPLHAVHLLGSGDCHYVSLFWLERIAGPFSLVLLDNHPDDQCTAFGGDILSCGSWVAEARKLPSCKETIWIRDVADFKLPTEQSVYLSIDLDVLSRAFACTNWDQGTMSLPQLCGIIKRLREERSIIGADICGGISESQGAKTCDLALNRDTVDTVYGMFR